MSRVIWASAAAAQATTRWTYNSVQFNKERSNSPLQERTASGVRVGWRAARSGGWGHPGAMPFMPRASNLYSDHFHGPPPRDRDQLPETTARGLLGTALARMAWARARYSGYSVTPASKWGHRRTSNLTEAVTRYQAGWSLAKLATRLRLRRRNSAHSSEVHPGGAPTYL
jgi:hypothetical protein